MHSSYRASFEQTATRLLLVYLTAPLLVTPTLKADVGPITIIQPKWEPTSDHKNSHQLLKPQTKSDSTNRLFFPDQKDDSIAEVKHDRQKELEAIIKETLMKSEDTLGDLDLAGINARTIPIARRTGDLHSTNPRPIADLSQSDRQHKVDFPAHQAFLRGITPTSSVRRDDHSVLQDSARQLKRPVGALNQPGPWNLAGPWTAGIVDHKKYHENCITRTKSGTQRCEDNLVKKLYQDASEGRTVVDVTRRVCCALFTHKRCISETVLDACPDSSPIAADFLIGPRKLDLTRSCLRFNGEGCNGAQKLLDINFRVLAVTSAVGICSLLINLVR